MSDTILIVDDEESARTTWAGWLAESDLDVTVLAAADAESALGLADAGDEIDLALLDWNLGSGDNGLTLLRDLIEFQPEITAILITGHAHQATPLDALRMGVRDYLEKPMRREQFIESVRAQLERRRPAKRARQINEQLREFREAVEGVLPVVRSTAAMNERVPLPEAVHGLLRFVVQSVGAASGVLVLRLGETLHVYDGDGNEVSAGDVAFADTVAASALGFGAPAVINQISEAGGVTLLQFETGRDNLLACPVPVKADAQAVLELFDKSGGFSESDKAAARTAADFGAELLDQALSQRQTNRMLLDALAAALEASDRLGAETGANERPPAGAALDRLRAQLAERDDDPERSEATLRLAEAVRELAEVHGTPALVHCTLLVESVRQLMGSATRADDA